MPLYSSFRRPVALAALWVYVQLGSAVIASDSPETSVPAELPKNLARLNCGAAIEISSHTGPQSGLDTNLRTLLLDDQTLDYGLPRGVTSVLITLPKIALVDRFTFINEQADARGTVQVAVSDSRLSLADDRWQSAGPDVRISGERFVTVPLTGAEAKYVRVTFQLATQGKIAAIGIYGRKTLQSFSQHRGHITDAAATVAYITTPTDKFYDGLNYNFANLYARARVIYVSSGDSALAPRMIDDDPATSYEFAADDVQPTMVLELAQSQRLRRVSAVYEMRSGRLDIYLLDHLPADLRSVNWEQTKPIVTLRDDTGSGKAAADFDPHGARYICLRWTPQQIGKHRSFKICEVGAFSDISPLTMGWVDMPERLAISTGVAVVPSTPPVIIPVSP